MAAPTSKDNVDAFDCNYGKSDAFSLENKTWKRLEEQRYKVDLRRTE